MILTVRHYKAFNLLLSVSRVAEFFPWGQLGISYFSIAYTERQLNHGFVTNLQGMCFSDDAESRCSLVKS